MHFYFKKITLLTALILPLTCHGFESINSISSLSELVKETPNQQSSNSVNSDIKEVKTIFANLAFHHYPAFNFDEIQNQLKESIRKTSKEFGVSESLRIEQQISRSRSVDDLLSAIENYYDESGQTIPTKHHFSRSLSRNILSIPNDKYTRLLNITEPKIPQLNTEYQSEHIIESSITIDNFNGNDCKLDIDTTHNIVIDLRDNGGGNMRCTLDALSSILPKGEQLVGKLETNDFTKDLYAKGVRKTQLTGTIIVNKNTASSAEFFYKVLKKRGWKIIGGDTFGKTVTQYRFKSKLGDYMITFGRYIPM